MRCDALCTPNVTVASATVATGSTRMVYLGLLALVAFALYGNLARIVIGSKYILLLADGGLLMLTVYSVAMRLLSGRLLTFTETLVLALLGIGGLCMFHPNIPSLMAGVEGFRQTLYQMLALFVGVAVLNSREKLIRFLTILAVLSIPILLWAVKQFFVLSAIDMAIIATSSADIYTWAIFGKIRAFGFFSGPFHMGLFAGFLFWASVALYLEDHRRRWLAFAVLCFLACLATLTRGSLIAICATFPVVLFYVVRSYRRRVTMITTASLVVVIAVTVLLATQVEAVGNVIESVSAVSSLSEDSRLAGRFEGYHEGIAAVGANPFGIGMGSAADALGHYFEPYKDTHITSHNILLRVALEVGWIGLGLFLAVLWYIFSAARRLKRAGDYPLAVLVCGWLGILLITGITGSSINAYPVNLLLWLVVGGVIGYSANSKSLGAK